MPISTIAVTIIDELKKLGVKSSLDYVREVLPEAYKNQRFRQLAQIAHEKRKTNEIKPEIEGQGCKTQGFPCDVRDIDIHPIIPIQDLKEYSPKIIGDKLQSAMEIIQHNKHALRQYEKTMFVQQKELEELAETNDIEILTAVKQENSIISTQKPTIVQKCDYSCALHDLQDTLFRTARYVEEHAEKVEEYPILDVQIDKNCAQRIANFDKIIQGFGEFIQVTNDERFAQSKWDWFETVINEERWGKNAAARKASIEGIDSVDEKTGKPKVRPLTAKTVKNNKDSVWNDMQEFSKQMDDFAFWKSFADWRKHSEFDQRIADRRLKVSPKLSESAIGGCNK